jgi:DNA-binding transcriptional LysR family regulator
MDLGFTLDQLRVLVAVVETGSFSAAARRLHRTQGAVSYNIKALEQQLGIALFDRAGRLPSLTEAGRAILREANGVLERTQRLGATASAVRSGLEPSVSLAIDVLFPSEHLAEIILDFESEFPSVELELWTGVLADVVTRVRHGAAHLGVSGAPDLPADVVVGPCETVELQVVSAPFHPLAHHSGPIDDSSLREHTNIVLAETDTATGQEVGLGRRVWRVSDAAVRSTLLRKGLGWARVPVHQIEHDLASGKLLQLPTARWPNGTKIELRTIHPPERPPGPAGTWLLARLQSPST